MDGNRLLLLNTWGNVSALDLLVHIDLQPSILALDKYN